MRGALCNGISNIFLGFDGVLNTEDYHAQLRAEGNPGWDDYGIFCEELLTADLSDLDRIRKAEGLAKGKEIRAWLRRHTGPDSQYVILDDMAEFEGELQEHAIIIDP